MIIHIRNWRSWLLLSGLVLLSLLALTLGGSRENSASSPDGPLDFPAASTATGPSDSETEKQLPRITVAESLGEEPGTDTAPAQTEPAAATVSANPIWGSDDDDPGRIKASLANHHTVLLAEYRLRRERIRGERSALLQDIVASAQSTDSAREAAELELLDLTRQAERELKAETMIRSQGIDECVIMLDGVRATAIVSSAGQEALIHQIIASVANIEEEQVTVLVAVQ